MNIRLRLLLMILLSMLDGNAQPYIDIINIGYQQFPRTSQFKGDLLLPVELKKDILLFGASFSKQVFDKSGDSMDVRNLYATSVQFGIIKQWKNEKWTTLFMAIPKISSDLKVQMGSQDLQMGGIVLFTLRKHEDLKYKFGVYYNSEFFGPFFIPLLGIDWKINERLNLFGILPGGMNLEYKLRKQLYTGFSYESITASYRINSQSGGDQYLWEGHPFWGHNQLRVFVNYYPAKNMMLYTELGHTFFRRYKRYEGDKIVADEAVRIKTKDGIFFNLGMALRVRLDQNRE